ncbi:hypothetical protein BDV41DRAFT_547321 [Aspergillus transmontanensis]|uniref:Uncharacterized protein n=1 Tax=Aspergillus transmontanensis TaxID=1034304 RepID=A0A5N6VRB0_9EURO|nr:hypothetical protein BDV41DRAFT_547321 [Aspergillus transmontanensis]
MSKVDDEKNKVDVPNNYCLFRTMSSCFAASSLGRIWLYKHSETAIYIVWICDGSLSSSSLGNPRISPPRSSWYSLNTCIQGDLLKNAPELR